VAGHLDEDSCAPRARNLKIAAVAAGVAVVTVLLIVLLGR